MSFEQMTIMECIMFWIMCICMGLFAAAMMTAGYAAIKPSKRYSVVRRGDGEDYYIAKNSIFGSEIVHNTFQNPIYFESKEEAEKFIKDRLTWHRV